MEPEPKKMKVDRPKPPPRRITSASTTVKKDATMVLNKAQTAAVVPITVPMINVPTVQNNVAHLKIQQAKNFAVEQARRDGCMGSFKIFDSPYGNFLLPVIPTRAELGG